VGKQAYAPFRRPLLVSQPGTRLLVIHDWGEPPNGAPVDALVREATGRLVLQAQPAYSPELKPQERLWKGLRRVVSHHHWGAPLGAPIAASGNFCRDLADVKEQVRR
jgi:hypothetical protein